MTISIRHQVAGGWLLALASWPVVATMQWNHFGWGVDGIATLLMLGFCLCMGPEVLRGLNELRKDRVARLGVLILLPSIAAWYYFQGLNVFSGAPESMRRFWLYLVMPAFFVGAREWFAATGDAGIRRVFIARSVTVLLAAIAITYAMIVAGSSRFRHDGLPVYWHIRHFNYDLVLLAGFAIYLMARAKAVWQTAACVLACVAIGYFTAWSGGRGGMLATVLVFVFLLVFGAMRRREPAIWLAAGAMLLGGLLVVVAGHDQLFERQIQKLASASASTVTSGRTGIWLSAVEKLITTPESALFGFGPDATLRVGIGHWNKIAMAHNSIVQWLFEFGFLGAPILIAAFARATKNAVIVLRHSASTPLAKIMSALLLAVLVFSMTDGLLYHLVPLVMVLMMCAYLAAVARRADASSPASHHAGIRKRNSDSAQAN